MLSDRSRAKALGSWSSSTEAQLETDINVGENRGVKWDGTARRGEGAVVARGFWKLLQRTRGDAHNSTCTCSSPSCTRGGDPRRLTALPRSPQGLHPARRMQQAGLQAIPRSHRLPDLRRSSSHRALHRAMQGSTAPCSEPCLGLPRRVMVGLSCLGSTGCWHCILRRTPGSAWGSLRRRADGIISVACSSEWLARLPGARDSGDFAQHKINKL